MVRRGSGNEEEYHRMEVANTLLKVLFKRKPVALIPHPVNIKDDADVCWEYKWAEKIIH